MKRISKVLCLILAILLAALALPGLLAEGAQAPEDGDDSVVVPVDSLSDEGELIEETIEGRELRYGDDGEDVKEIQTILKSLKYYTGNLSGRYREGTRDAVKSFQTDYELEVTGVADAQTLALLYAAKYRTLRYGASGDDVKALQKRLMELGYYKSKVSGNYLDVTQSAVVTFQKINGLTMDGVADPETQEILFSDEARDASAGVPETPTPAPPLSDFIVDDQAENSTVVMPEERVEFTKKLKNGDSGKLVKQLQQRMKDLGYYDGPVSGNYMVKTTRAVKQIQTQNGMEATGVTDEDTWNLIFNNVGIVMPQDTPKPTPEPTPVPFAITVDVANQVTTVYGLDENGNYTVIVRQMLCSTGMKATPSDVGDWVLNGRKANWCNFPKWGSYARYWTRINSAIAFHSVIYNAVDLKAVNTKSFNMLGNRASHGCIRLTVKDAKWIYDNVGAGTVVSIVEGMEAQPELRDALKRELPTLDKKTGAFIAKTNITPEPEYHSGQKPDIGKRTLKEKSEGEDVFWVQMRLTELGYYNSKCSGRMLAQTVKAVKAYQKAHGIYASGTVNQELIDMMAEEEV